MKYGSKLVTLKKYCKAKQLSLLQTPPLISKVLSFQEGNSDSEQNISYNELGW
jgi:hypothetical protein